jgi:hypothetical protein
MGLEHVRVEQLVMAQAVLAQDRYAGVDVGAGSVGDHDGSLIDAFQMQI